MKVALQRFRRITLAAAFSVAIAAAQYDVSSFGAIGDGNRDDTFALQQAINATSPGGSLNFGGLNKTYLISSRLTLQPNVTYTGKATIRMSSYAPAHTAIAKLVYGASSNVTINGLTFDANGVGGGIQIAVDGTNAIPASNLIITQSIFRNTTSYPNGPWDSAIYDPVGLVNSQITNNQIINCGGGIYITNGQNIVISDNKFQTVHQMDAIYLLFSAAPFQYGQGIQVLRNTGQHLGRMGVEAWPNGGNTGQSSVISGILVSDNSFSDFDAGYDQIFGISMMAGQQNIIQHNKLVTGTGGVGIELGAANSVVDQNSITGFQTGILVHDAHGSRLTGNMLNSQTIQGIEFSNAPGSRAGMVLQNNSIINSQILGIFINTSDWGGTTISGNYISRAAGAYPADPYQTFMGIAITPPYSPVTITGNSILQSALYGPASFGFMGLRVNGASGANVNSNYSNNVVTSMFMFPQSFGVYGNSDGSLNGTFVQGNNFTGLYGASGGSGSAGVYSNSNLIYNCNQVGPIPLNQ